MEQMGNLNQIALNVLKFISHDPLKDIYEILVHKFYI